MAEFNPYKLEEEKWTPNNVYEILPPNAVSWTNYQYSEGTDNVDTEAANKSLIDGFVDFFAELLGTAGQILGGAVELGGAVLGGFVDGVVSLIGGIANAIGSIFGGGSSESPNLPLFNPIKTNLEAAIQPHRDKINESWQKTEEILAEQEVLRGQMADSLEEMRDASSRAQEATERAGVAITEAEAASAAATAAREDLESYNTELNQRITTEFNSAVGRADTAVEKADTLAGELADFKAQHQREIDEALGKAEQGIKDAKTANDAIKSLNTSLNSKIEEQIKASDYLEEELAKADSSVTAVSDLVRLQNPWKWTADWVSGADVTQTPTTMSMSTVAEGNRLNNRGVTHTRIPLIAGRTYRIRAICKGSGSIQIGFYRTLENGNYSSSIWPSGCSKSFTDSVDHYIDWTCEYGENETKVRGVIYIRGVMTVESVVVQDISDLALVQPQINEGFTMALKAHQTLFEGQQNWNATQEAINRFNSTQWAKQADLNTANNLINTAQNDAIAALQSATQLAIPDHDISPKTGQRPNWSNGLGWGAWVDWNLGKPNSVKMDIPTYVVDKTSWVVNTSDNSYFVPVEGMKLRIRVAIRAISSDSGGATHVRLTDKDNKAVIVSDQYVEQRAQGQVTGYRPDNQVDSRDYCSVWTSHSGTNTNWTFWERVVEIKPNSGPIKIHVRNTSATTRVHFGCRISSVIPTQEAVDKAQNDAISANTEALKALGKKALGASLVPYKTPSTQEVKDYAAGKLKYDPWADPEYFDAGYFIVNPMRGRVVCANPDQGVKEFKGSYVSVDSSIEYKVKFHTYAASHGSKMYIHMYDQNGALAIAETPFADSGRGSGDLVNGITLPRGLKEWSGVVKFKPGTTEVCLGTFFWNDPSGSITTAQEFGGLEIVPNIPDANVVNELQDNAIRKNTEVGTENKNAIEALRDGLNAAVELGEVSGMLEDLRGELEAEAKKREALQEKIDALQTEMIPRTIVSDDRVTYDDYVELSRREVTAKGSWAGQLAITYTINSGEKTLVTRKNVPHGTTRSWTFSDGVERVDYWVYQGRPRTIQLRNAGPYITGSSFSNGTWGVLATHKVGKTYGTGKIEWRANLLYADRDTTYRFAIKVNGASVKNVAWTKQGPLTPLGDGKRTLRFEHEFNLPDNATVEVLGYAAGGGSHQAKVSLLQGTLYYVQDTAREAQ